MFVEATGVREKAAVPQGGGGGRGGGVAKGGGRFLNLQRSPFFAHAMSGAISLASTGTSG